MSYYSQSVNSVLKALNSHPNGLSNLEAKRQLEKYGRNEFKKKRRATVAEMFLSQFKSVIVLILLIAVALSAALGEMIDAIVISAIVIFNGVFGTIQEYRAEKAMGALELLASPSAKVIRGGKRKLVPAWQLVPGDMIFIEAGDAIGADARIISSMNLMCDESSLTGESVPSQKSAKPARGGAGLAERNSMVYMGTTATYGHATAVVTATGMDTEMGKIAGIIQSIDDTETPLQKRLDELGKKLGVIILLITATLFALELFENPEIIRYAISFGGDLSLLLPKLASTNIVELFLVAVSLAVSAIPEGLPAIVTITLAIGLQRMAKRNAIVRKLAAVETLGSTTAICTDKTGTLTKNEMTVQKVFVNNEMVDVSGAGYAPHGSFSKKPPGLQRLLEIAAGCNNAELVDDGGWTVIGDPTEGCLLTLAAKGGITKKPRLDELSFDSTRKRMTTFHRHGPRTIAMAKGAPESILGICGYIMVNGKTKKLTPSQKEKMMDLNNKLASSAYRVLAFAYRELPQKFDKRDAESKMVFVGMVGMIDPPRPEAKAAIKAAHGAGIRVIMVTGDNELTAKAIAIKVGLCGGGEKAVTGSMLDGMDSLAEIVEDTIIYARVSPEHKLAIVRALQEKGDVVAVTGDGINDAPALKTADIGIAMGISGTEVSKGASDIILRDDNFATIIAAVEEGRRIYGNIQNFIKYLLASNFDEIIVVGGAALMGMPLPFLPVQILWINLITDGFPALALGLDPPDPTVMEKKPRQRHESIFSGISDPMIMTGAIAAAATFIAFAAGLGTGIEKARTMAFTTSVLFELFFVYNCRSSNQSVFRGLFKNRALMAAVGLSFLLQFAVIYTPLLHQFFKTVPLGIGDWAIVLPLSMLALLPFLGNFWSKD